MRTVLALGGGLIWLAVLCPGVHAGLYLPAEFDDWPFPRTYKGFQLLLGDRISAALAAKTEEPKKAVTPKDDKNETTIVDRVRDQVNSLQQKRRDGTITVEEAVVLGGCLILMTNHDKAIEVLTQAHSREPRNFRVLGNLVVAYQGKGLLERAVLFQEQMLAPGFWPRQVPGWTAERLRWQRRADVIYLTLLRQRYQESLRQPPGVGTKEITLDKLFPGVRFIGPGGKYVAGEIDVRMQDKLPSDAVALVEQLILWLPHDMPLRWLLGEVLNAQGDIHSAHNLIDDLVYNRGLRGEGLLEHRTVLGEAVKVTPKPSEVLETPPELTKDNSSGQPTSWLPSWRDLAVGFLAGLVFGMLLVFQFRPVRRSAAPARTSSPSIPSPAKEAGS